MRALALSLAALVAVPALGHAQARASAAPPPPPADAHPWVPMNGLRLESRPAPATRPGQATPGFGTPGFGSPGYGPFIGYERPPAPPADTWNDRRGTDFGAGRRTQPIVIVVPPYGAYGNAYGGYYGSTYSTGYTGSYGAPSARSAEQTGDEDAAGARYEPAAPARVLEVASATPASVSLAVERLAGSLLRLRWTGREPGVREVALVVADSARRLLATQTVSAAPFSAVFDNAARIAFVGTTVVRADGVITTTLVPLGLASRTPRPRAPLPPLRRTPG